MEIPKLLEKLEPLMPAEVRQWRRTLPMVDERTRRLLEKEILSTGYDILGDFNKKLLLSLPSKKKAQGTFHLGTVLYETEKWPCGITRNELLQNLAIFGRSGAGKTNVAFHLLTQMVREKVPFLFLDWKRTARHLLPYIKQQVNIYTPGRSLSPFVFNPFIPPPGLEHNLYINHLVDILGSAFTLGDGSKSILQQAISSCYHKKTWPTVHDVLAVIEQHEVKSRAHGWKTSAIRALQSLEFSALSKREDLSQQDLVNSLLRESTIIELDGLAQSAKKFLVPMLCLWLYYVKLAAREREQLQLVIFVEEAHHVLYKQEHRSQETVMNMLLRQCRELGIGMIIIDQHPSLISRAALGNTYTSICLNHKDPTDINRAAGLSLVPDSEKKWLSMLPVGQGIVKLQDRWFKPFLVQFPWVRIEKGAVTDDVLSSVVKGSGTLSAIGPAIGKQLHRDEQSTPDDRVLSEDEFIFLHDVLQHPEDGVDARYKRLGIGVNKGNRLKETLVSQGWLIEQVVPLGKTRKLLLKIPDNAIEMLGVDITAIAQESVVHNYWKRFYARVFQDDGYSVKLEAPRSGGRVDVLATNAKGRVGIEIETGKSDVVSNVKHCLLSTFDKVFVVATSEPAMTTIERQLAQAGLFIPSRIELVLRDELSIKMNSSGMNTVEAA